MKHCIELTILLAHRDDRGRLASSRMRVAHSLTTRQSSFVPQRRCLIFSALSQLAAQ